MRDEEGDVAKGCVIAMAMSVAIWGMIALILFGCAGPGDERLVRCQREAPPWATGECHP